MNNNPYKAIWAANRLIANIHEVESPVVPDVAGTISGYRLFRYVEIKKGGLVDLISVTRDVKWTIGSTLEAQHQERFELYGGSLAIPGHNVPYLSCSCGIYALNSLEELARNVHNIVYGMQNIVGARVDLWGRIIEHETGYRAEYARISGFIRELTRPEYVAERMSQFHELELITFSRAVSVPFTTKRCKDASVRARFNVGDRVRNTKWAYKGVGTITKKRNRTCVVRIKGHGHRCYYYEDLESV